MTFQSWFKELLIAADAVGWRINLEHPLSYKEYFDDGHSPKEALDEELACAEELSEETDTADE